MCSFEVWILFTPVFFSHMALNLRIGLAIISVDHPFLAFYERFANRKLLNIAVV